jgi:NitT/TauT family transport system substrate-binding protein
MRLLSASVWLLATFCLGATPAWAAVEKITVASLTDPGYEAALWALQHGKVVDPTIEVTVDEMPIPALIQAAMTQQYNILPLGVLSVPQMAESGIGVKIIATLLRYHPEGHADDIWVMANSPIKTVADLKGRTIAVPSTEAQNVVSLRAIMSEHYGLNAASIGGDMRFAEMPATQFEAALTSGRVDAAVFSNVQAYAAGKKPIYRSILQGSKELLEMYGGPMPSIVWGGYTADMDKRPAAYIAFAKLLRASAEYVGGHEEEVFAAVAPKFKMEPSDLKMWFTTYSEEPFAIGPTDASVIAKAWHSGAALGALQKAPPSAAPFIWSEAVKE